VNIWLSVFSLQLNQIIFYIYYIQINQRTTSRDLDLPGNSFIQTITLDPVVTSINQGMNPCITLIHITMWIMAIQHLVFTLPHMKLRALESHHLPENVGPSN
jgi:hypothetical protein